MNTQLKQSKNKFSLQAGTTNRHKWHKQTVSALQVLDRLKTETLEKWGTIGGEERENVVMFGGITNETADNLYNEIGEKFNWLITKENADKITAAVIAVLPAAREAMPVEDNRKTPETLNNEAFARQTANKEREAADAIKAEKIAEIKADLMARYPYAAADDGKMSSHARAAKNMKQELKRAFPHVKFSVRSESFSMGNPIRVEWDNGPATKTVDAITNKYQYYIDKCTDDTYSGIQGFQQERDFPFIRKRCGVCARPKAR